jgi:cytochrome b6-f complex iron-sulfur subunit
MSDTDSTISRRQFFAGAWCATSSAALAILFAGCSGKSSDASPSGDGGSVSTLGKSAGKFTAGTGVQVTVSGSALASVGGAVLVDSIAGEFLLARTGDNTFSAIEAVCTHEGCTITGADGAVYVCPCHGSRYDRSGHVVLGPAQASLRQYPTTFAGDVVTIGV